MGYHKDENGYTPAKLFVEQRVIPLETYPGRKGANGAWQKIVSNIPQCDLFIEAMAGSAFLSSMISGCSMVINDIDRSIIDKISYPSETVHFSSQDYECIIDRYDNGNKRRIFYFDPPYVFDTRSYQLPIYKYDWNIADHKRFLKLVVKMKCPVMVSHYPCDMYDKALKNWRKITYSSMTRAGIRKESLYMNFKQPALLQHPEHVGEDFTDRQRIKRKIARLVAKLNREDEHERAAILTSVVKNFDYIKGKNTV